MPVNHVKVRDSARSAIKRYMVASQDEKLYLNSEMIDAQIELLNEQWRKFVQAQDAVDMACGPDVVELEEQERAQAEHWYIIGKSNFQRQSKAFAQTAPAAAVSQVNASVRLPKMDLPTFTGEPTEWISFHDLFQSLVCANPNLTDAQKLHYLRSCLKGEALHLISSFKISGANYNEAWELLKSRYAVLRVIVDHHMQAIVAIPKASKDNAQEIKQVIDTTQQHLRALQALGRPVEFWDDWLVHSVASRLAFETRKQWELSLTDDAVPTFEQIYKFLETRCRSLEMLSPSTQVPQVNSAAQSKKAQRTSTQTFHAVNGHSSQATKKFSAGCLYCNADHKIYSCPEFLKLSPTEREQAVKQRGACHNCLSRGHYKAKCSSTSSCRVCRSRHHTLLHRDCNSAVIASEACIKPNPATSSQFNKSFVDPPTNSAYSNTGAQNWVTSSTAHAVSTAEHVVLLATVLLHVQDYAGRWQTVRGLFDNGSHASFITESCAQRLRLPRRAAAVSITGIGASNTGHARGEITMNVFSQISTDLIKIDALILPRITNDLPTTHVNTVEWSHTKDLHLADPNFATPGPIDLLIGMDQMDQLLLTDLRKGEPGTPIAQSTVFGWVLLGRVSCSSEKADDVQSFHCEVKLLHAVNRLWELEEFPNRRFLTNEEEYCETHFAQTHRRASDGRFIVQLPFRKSVTLGESRGAAVRSLLRMEKRFENDRDLRMQYSEFMRELIQMGHMEPVFDTPDHSYYLPHHAVLKDSSSTTKLRVVFNASMKTSSGCSLNDALMVGPQLQPELFSILIRFRTHRFAMTADVEKMYRQVRVCDEHTNFQRVVWRESSAQPVQDYRLLRVTYGISSASFLAVRSLQQTAKDSGKGNEDASNAILNDFYMDDLLTGSSSAETLESLQGGISKLLSSSGFQLRKWATNCKTLAKSLPDVSTKVSHYLASEQQVSTLGLLWNTDYDLLSFKVNLKPLPAALSKRAFLSDASTLYDPLGLLAPCTIKARIWFQEIWTTTKNWDDLIPRNIANQWVAHRNELTKLSSLQQKRWLGTNDGAITEFHLFTDASERAYAAALYARTIFATDNVIVSLVAARARVAPLKATTLPRLELCAAHLGAKLTKHIMACFPNQSYDVYAWTDSTVTLAWLQGHPRRWSTFVANRVAHIQEIISADQWGHIRSECNPADCASRGVSPGELLTHKLWWTGPKWLADSNDDWKNNAKSKHTTNAEMRREEKTVNLMRVQEPWDLLTRFSSYGKLKRVTAYLLRFIGNLRAKSENERKYNPLTCAEIFKAELALIRYTQFLAFPNELSSCREGKPVPLKSPLLRLQPFLDKRGILRVGGRLEHAPISPDRRHGMLIPKRAPIAKLIVLEAHTLTLHGGPQMMQAVLQRRFWLLGGRNLYRNIYRNCVRCTRLNRRPLQQSMANLPLNRLVYTRCFVRSAVDFAGPFLFKFSAGRGARATKGYLSSFICMGTGAMHLEFVSDLSSKAFINALKRFVSRRGYCQHLHSDNGTNFTAADKDLRMMLDMCKSDPQMNAYFANHSITWHFNPPNAPHMGGYWEVGIRRVKYHIKRALGTTLLTYEEFSTLLSEVEACVNSRPLCSQSSDVNDLDVLTPGHFLIGEPLKLIAEPDSVDFKGSLGKRWQVISAIRQHFWRRWRDEYLPSLQKRTKWYRPSPNLEENDIVVIIDERVPPTNWKLAKVIKCCPGSDGRVRVALVKTAAGESLRPIVKLCRLPTSKEIFRD